ncbi:hypothetical protein B0T21DRAFT_280736 [Apiosordaria backusii]|uniref:LysM domain-containing protein n=1 Tax=Apiosordaria backusii TaxID=314023 RepID=A0AA40ESC6_9PEZI|nr:hypothetical protein B0T21DRAFT_280736 [Apiosordaria backusii]
MKFTLSTALLTGLAALVSAQSPQMPGLAANCNRYHYVQSGDTCAVVAANNGISVAQFLSWNTAVDSGCTNLWLGYYVCTGVSGSLTGGGSFPTSTSEPMPGLPASCWRFHTVAAGDTCEVIVSRYGISLGSFYAWNPTLNSGCTNMWLGHAVCVGA